MYSRILVRLAAPLILTLLFPLSVVNSHQISPEHASVVREQDALLTDLRRFVIN